jgi:tripartite-type tricarboxylate transporter receptor subunit TctC
MRIHRRTLLGSALALPFIGSQGWAQSTGQSFPNRPLTIAIPFAAGGPTDMIARLLAEGMSRELGQPVAAENVTGAGGTIAAARVAQARPDGHTMLIYTISGWPRRPRCIGNCRSASNAAFAPLGVVSHTGMTFVARPDFPAQDLAGYIAALREQGDRLNLGHSRVRGIQPIMRHAAAARGGTQCHHCRLPWQCASDDGDDGRAARHLLRAGHGGGAPSCGMAASSAYAVTLPQRVPGFDVPTTREQGLDLIMSAWHGLYAVAGTPPEIQQRLAQAMRAALRDDRLKQRFAETLTTVATEEEATPAHHTRFLASEIARLRPLIVQAGQFAD